MFDRLMHSVHLPFGYEPFEPCTKFSKRGALRGPQFLEGGKGVVAIFK